jgi:hypothetical protein
MRLVCECISTQHERLSGHAIIACLEGRLVSTAWSAPSWKAGSRRTLRESSSVSPVDGGNEMLEGLD